MKIDRRSLLRCSLAWPATLPIWSGTLLQGAEFKDDRREETLTKVRPATAGSLADAIVIKHENVFFVAQPDGSVPLKDSHGMGLYYHDCRYVNGYEIELAGRKPAYLSASSVQGAIGVFALTNPRLELTGGAVLEEEELGITWRRLIDIEAPSLRDRLYIQNFTPQELEFPITLTIQSAFEDLFAVRGLLPKRLSPRGQERIDVTLVIGESKGRAAAGRSRPDPEGFSRLDSALEREREIWMTHVTKVVTNGSALDQLMERSFRGLRVLRTHLGNETYFAVIRIWRSKSAKDLSMTMLVTFTTGVFCWLVYGVMIDSLPVIIANAVTFVLAGMNLMLKLRYG